MLWTDLPDQLDTSAFSIVLAIAKGQTFDKREAALAAFNVIGYASNAVLPTGPTPMMAGAECPAVEYTDEEVDEAFAKVIESDGTMAATPEAVEANGKWLQIILSVALKILPLILVA